MRRGFVLAAVVMMLAPLALTVASVCSASPCCAAAEDRIAAAMPCCQPTMCANPSPGRETKAVDAQAPAIAPLQLTEVATSAIAVQRHGTPRESSSPPPVRVRLALISTLLI